MSKARAAFEGMSPEDLWNMLGDFPRVAGPWRHHFTETMRVETILVRDVQLRRDEPYDRHSPSGSVASVWGPTSDGKWLWRAGFSCRRAGSKEEAMALADAELARNRYLLVKEREFMTRQSEKSVWLDDERPAPFGWTHVKTSAECIEILKREDVGAISLDHDLGGDDNGYIVACWLEERAAEGLRVPEIIRVHSANAVGRARIEQAIVSISKLVAARDASDT
ncbi:MAG TPA: cyclic-phosphate processing receiver domain-containing protein [Thermoanaerobaculia bacterium]|jgi:hypothetical protein|nr:cyclic-phosphate processing receiver domain-containing protein [Thermoanaerobaculia bacterium]